jgi:spermidine dehydrogenase
MRERDRALGIGRSISRRDFIGGVGVALSGSLLSCSWAKTEAPLDPAVDATAFGRSTQKAGIYYPSTRTGMRGSHAGSFEVAHRLREGRWWDESEIEDLGETYDLVVVGGGLSGLSAAWFYREAEPNARVLIFDNHHDFGGHAKRNEFWHEGKMLLSHGGTDLPGFFGPAFPREQPLCARTLKESGRIPTA